MPASSNPELTALFVTGPKEAIAFCRKALQEANGNRQKAAEILGVSDGTLYRWIRERPEIVEGKGKNAVPQMPKGRPRGRKNHKNR